MYPAVLGPSDHIAAHCHAAEAEAAYQQGTGPDPGEATEPEPFDPAEATDPA